MEVVVVRGVVRRGERVVVRVSIAVVRSSSCGWRESIFEWCGIGLAGWCVVFVML